jgi:hypothetical protein
VLVIDMGKGRRRKPHRTSTACKDSPAWLDANAVLVTCSSLAAHCSGSLAGVLVWQQCPQTCGTCYKTCPSSIEPEATVLIDRVGFTQPYRLLSWWYMDVAVHGWRSHFPRMLPAARTNPRREARVAPGGLHVVDSFVNLSMLSPLRVAMDHWRDGIEWQKTSVNGARVRMVQSSMDACSRPTPDWAGGPTYALIRDLLGRMIGYVNTHIEVVGSTLGEAHAFSPARGFHLTHWTIYDYLPSSASAEQVIEQHRVQPHVDSHWDGRCLSVAVHLDNGHAEDSDAGLSGGVFQTHRCARKSDCDGLGGARLAELEAAGRDSGPQLAATLSEQPEHSASFKPGRLLAFLAETPHSVTPLTRGSRRILFAFFSCRVPQAGPPRDARDEIRQPPLSRWDAHAARQK